MKSDMIARVINGPSAAPAIQALLEHGVKTKNFNWGQAICERLVSWMLVSFWGWYRPTDPEVAKLLRDYSLCHLTKAPYPISTVEEKWSRCCWNGINDAPSVDGYNAVIIHILQTGSGRGIVEAKVYAMWPKFSRWPRLVKLWRQRLRHHFTNKTCSSHCLNLCISHDFLLALLIMWMSRLPQVTPCMELHYRVWMGPVSVFDNILTLSSLLCHLVTGHHYVHGSGH